MLRVTPREYQSRIYSSIKEKGNTLVVLPTGLGKTIIALMAIDETYHRGGSSLFLAPTRPLVEQHYTSILSQTDIPADQVVMVTGVIPPNKRKELWKKKVVVSTPQTVANDIEKGILKFEYDLCVFDEAHRAVGKYAYTVIAEKAKKHKTLIIGLTASPGSDKKKISEIMDNLGITNVEVRDRHDKDVEPYVKEIKFKWVFVELSDDLKKVSNLIRTMIKEKVEFFRSWGIRGKLLSKSYLVELKEKLLKMESDKKYMLLSQYAYLFNLVHLLELIETQGTTAALQYVEKLRQRRSKAVKAMFKDERFKEVITLLSSGIEHPKLNKLVEIIKREKGQVIVFSQYVSQITLISQKLTEAGISNHIFVGQRKGFTQKKQKEIIQQFREGRFRVLVSSSVGEEGLDIPSVDTVIFFEPIPSAIRSIQRRGRAGRTRMGKVIIMITRKTQDEVFYWSAYHKEKKMRRIMSSFEGQFKSHFTQVQSNLANSVLSRSEEGNKKHSASSSRKKEGGVQLHLTDFIDD